MAFRQVKGPSAVVSMGLSARGKTFLSPEEYLDEERRAEYESDTWREKYPQWLETTSGTRDCHESRWGKSDLS